MGYIVMHLPTDFTLVTREISIKKNDVPNGEYPISPNVTRTIDKIDDNRADVRVDITIENKEGAAFPVDIKVSVSGIFGIGNIPEEDRKEFLEIDGFNIVFPYARAMVSGITAQAMMPSILLPPIDPRVIFNK